MFVLHPAMVIGRSGDQKSHFVSLGQLVRFYRLQRVDDWRSCSCLSARGGHADVEGSINLYPRYDGDYWDATVYGAQGPDGQSGASRHP